jgi:hypothetical protein
MGSFPIAISILALFFSIYVFADNRKRDRRDVFLGIHQLLYSDDLQRGRNILFRKITNEASVEQLSDQDYRDVTRVLGAYNALGLYMKNKYVNERDVMNSWAESAYLAWKCAQPYLDYREHHDGYRPWSNLERLAQKSQQELSRREPDLLSKIDAANTRGKGYSNSGSRLWRRLFDRLTACMGRRLRG